MKLNAKKYFHLGLWNVIPDLLDERVLFQNLHQTVAQFRRKIVLQPPTNGKKMFPVQCSKNLRKGRGLLDKLLRIRDETENRQHIQNLLFALHGNMCIVAGHVGVGMT